MRQSGSQVAFEYLRSRIVSGELKPGTLINAQDMSVEIGVSRTPVRDALWQLEREGLITIKPRLGAVVRDMDFYEFQSLCELREALETHAAELAAERRTDLILDEMAENLEQFTDAIQRYSQVQGEARIEPFRQIIHADLAFHLLVASASQSPIIEREITRYRIIQRVILQPGLSVEGIELRERFGTSPTRSYKEHMQIYQAIRDRQGSKARQLMADHLRHGMKISCRMMKVNT